MKKKKKLKSYTWIRWYYIHCKKIYSINFIENNRKFCLSLDYNVVNNHLFVNGTEIIKFKEKDSEVVAVQLRLGNISKDFSGDNMKKKLE